MEPILVSMSIGVNTQVEVILIVIDFGDNFQISRLNLIAESEFGVIFGIVLCFFGHNKRISKPIFQKSIKSMV